MIWKLTEGRWKSPAGDVGKVLRENYIDMDGEFRPCWTIGVIVADNEKFWTVELIPGTHHHRREAPRDHDMTQPYRIRVSKTGGKGARFWRHDLHVEKCQYCVRYDVDAVDISAPTCRQIEGKST